MAARIRLQRKGRSKFPKYRVVVTSSEAGVNDGPIETIGNYFPDNDKEEKSEEIDLDEDRALHWLESGARPSDTVRDLFNSVDLFEQLEERRESATT
ncbi:MAG: 30S ribosomal protein S16 [bacterium]